MVRLKVVTSYDHQSNYHLSFNSNMVRLKVRILHTMRVGLWSFNSNMVRLKEEKHQSELKALGFQFQYGTIKRIGRMGDEWQLDKFQFQYGTIKSKVCEKNMTAKECFNSNMVRLKVQRHRDSEVFVWFQFQYGTIKRNVPIVVYCSFLVSIPIWYD